jgi:signal transduction histidine kinase
MQESFANTRFIPIFSFKVVEARMAQLLRVKTRLFKPLYTSSLILILLIFGQQVSSLWITLLTTQTVNKIKQAQIIHSEEEKLLKSVINDEERLFIKADNQVGHSFEDHLQRLYFYLKDQPNHIEKLDNIRMIYENLEKDRFARTNSSYISFHSTSEIKQNQLNALYGEIRILIELQKQLVIEYQNWLQELDNIQTNINIFSTLLILLGLGVHIWFLHRRIQIPLRKLTEVGKMWRDDHFDTQFCCDAAHEISDLAQVLNDMAKAANCRQQQSQERNQQLEDMILALSHDLRTPLIATRNTIDGMLKGAFGPIDSNWKELFEDYYQANEDLLKLIESLLDISRYESREKNYLRSDRLSWQQIFEKVIAQITVNNHHKTITYKYHISSYLPTVYGDELEIQRVVQNLLDNATRASEANQEICLEVISSGNTQVKVSVRDQGIGIALEDQENLFHRFIQGKNRRGRSGLGLYLCRQIIEAHKGAIGVESCLGEGSTFWFTLPVTTVPTSLLPTNNIWEKK